MKFLTKEEYDKTKRNDKRASHCPFCWEKKDRQNNEYFLRDNDHRFIIYPTKPCGGVHRYKKHLMLLPKKHHINAPTLSDEELLSRREAERWLESYYEGKQYCSFVRHTDEIKSVQHLHYHYFRGNLRYRDIAKSLLYYDKKEIKEKKAKEREATHDDVLD